jgi:hypothetical protein
MWRRLDVDDLTSANVRYLATWLASWPIRRKLKRIHRARNSLSARLPEPARALRHPGGAAS